MNTLKPGSQVVVHDYSSSCGIVNGQYQQYTGSINPDTIDRAIVIATGLANIPGGYVTKNSLLTDTIIQRTKDNAIIFIPSEYLTLVQEPC